jgi:hypothetical protein
MADLTQAILTATIPTLAVMIGILLNNSRLSDLRSDMDRRFDGMNRRFDDVNHRFDDRFDDVNRRLEDTRDLLRAEFLRVEQVLDARVKHLEENR